METEQADVQAAMKPPTNNELPKAVSEFMKYCAEAKEQQQNLVGEFNVALFDEAVALTVHRLHDVIEGDMA